MRHQLKLFTHRELADFLQYGRASEGEVALSQARPPATPPRAPPRLCAKAFHRSLSPPCA